MNSGIFLSGTSAITLISWLQIAVDDFLQLVKLKHMNELTNISSRLKNGINETNFSEEQKLHYRCSFHRLNSASRLWWLYSRSAFFSNCLFQTCLLAHAVTRTHPPPPPLNHLCLLSSWTFFFHMWSDIISHQPCIVFQLLISCYSCFAANQASHHSTRVAIR